MQHTIVHPWVSLSGAAVMFILAIAGGTFFVEGVTKQVVVIPVRDKYHLTSPQGVFRASRKKHPHIYFGSLTVWGAGTVGACLGGVLLCFQAAHDHKRRKERKQAGPAPNDLNGRDELF
jgi:hypothetical protein